MVASSQPLATAIGVEILEAGGSAADAAVATAAALNVTEPNMTGIGGDCFALYFEARTRKVTGLNGSGRAPAELSLERLRKEGLDPLPPQHPYTVTVPGACAAWCDLLDAFGKLGRARVLEPAAALADRGFPVAPITAALWSAAGRAQLSAERGGDTFLIEGRGPRAGETFRNPDLAETLRIVAEGGKDAFYRGRIAETIALAVRNAGGALSVRDLDEHRSSWEDPISTPYRDVRVHECSPNGQGLAALIALGILRGFDLASMDPLGPERLHLVTEALRLAFADARWFVADPEHEHVPVAELLSESYTERRRRSIDPRRANPAAERGSPFASSDTVYLCTVDAEGNACSFINSNYMAFGTGIVPRGAGFTLQNRGHNFSLEDGHPNAFAPGKRPYHTIIPGLLTRESDGSLYGPFGVMGGFMQPQGHVQVVNAMIDDALEPQAALSRPRLQLLDGNAGGAVVVEPEIEEATRRALSDLGHEVRVIEGLGRIQFGRGQIIRRDVSGTLWGGSDPRADGCAFAAH